MRLYVLAALAVSIAGLPVDHHHGAEHALTASKLEDHSSHAKSLQAAKPVKKKKASKLNRVTPWSKMHELNKDRTSKEILAGVNPHRDAGQSAHDKNHFKYRFQHVDQGTLTYYEYHAKRHGMVTFLEAWEVFKTI
jgi:hypothetical protein